MKVCKTCGTQNEEIFSSCVACGARLDSSDDYNSVGDDEVTTLLEPLDDKNSPQLSLKTDANTFSQAPAGGMQQFQSQPQMQNGWNPNPPVHQTNMPVQSDKKKIFIILGAIVAVTVLALVLIFVFGGNGGKVKNGANSPEEVAENFINAMDQRDIDMIEDLCPPFLDTQVEDIEDAWQEIETYEIGYEFIDVTSTYDYDSSEISDLEDKINYDYDANVSIDAACDVDFDYNITGSYLGETVSESSSSTIVAIKYKGKWFLYE